MGLDRERGILVVDDEPGIRDIMVCNLIGVGISAEVCENGRQAVEKMREIRRLGRKIDLLTDLRGVDGVVVAQQHKNMFPRLLRFIMTASKEDGIPEDLIAERFDKPFNPWTIAEKIRNARNLLSVSSR